MRLFLQKINDPMKHIFTLIVIIVLTSITLAQTNKQSITGYGYFHPQIEIVNDKPAIIWTDKNTKNLYFSTHNDADTFPTPIQLNPSGLKLQTYDWSGPDLSVWNNNIYVTFHSNGYETGHVYFVKSTDGGISFSDTVRVDNLSIGYAQYPDVVAYNDTIYITYMKHDANNANPRYVVTRSTDGGNSFETEVEAGSIVGNEACDCCQPEIIANEKYIIVLFRNNANNIRDIKGVISNDRGASFTKWFSPDDHLWNIQACPSTGPDARFKDTNTLLSVYRSSESGTGKIFLNEYDIVGDSTLYETEIIDFSSTIPNYPQMDYKNDKLAIVWEANDSSKEIFYNSTVNINELNGFNAVNLTNTTTNNESKPDVIINNNRSHIVYASGTHLEYLETDLQTGINKISTVNDFNIYPNPTTGIVNFDFGQHNFRPIIVKVFDISGKLIYSNNINSMNSVQLDLSFLNKGWYNIQIDNSTNVSNTSIIII